jgi:hypothetical protein
MKSEKDSADSTKTKRDKNGEKVYNCAEATWIIEGKFRAICVASFK